LSKIPDWWEFGDFAIYQAPRFGRAQEAPPMKRSRLAAIPFVLALFLVSAVLASSASATTPQWIVEGKALGAAEPLAKSTKVTETFAIKAVVVGVNVKVECTAMSLPKSKIEGERTRVDNPFEMEGCALTTGPAACSIPASFPLEPLTSTLEGTAGAFKLKFAPTTETPVMTIVISGTGCPIAGELPIKGTMSCNYPGVETETKNHVLEFSLSSGTELKFGGKNVTLTGKDEFWLSSNKNWKVA
jgi:hypothetical protein